MESSEQLSEGVKEEDDSKGTGGEGRSYTAGGALSNGIAALPLSFHFPKHFNLMVSSV